MLIEEKIRHKFKLALQCREAGDRKKSSRFCRQVLKLAPDHAEANHMSGNLACEAGNFQKAEMLINKAIAKDSEQARYYNSMAHVFEARGNYQQASVYYLKAIGLEPDRADYFYKLGNMMLFTRSFIEARQVLQTAIGINPDYFEAYNSLGVSLQKLNKHEEAERAFKNSLRLNNDYWDVHENYGKFLIKGGRCEEAVEILKRSLKIRPEHIESLYRLAEAYIELMELDKAYSCFNRAAEIDPVELSSHMGMGKVALFSGDFNLAETHYRRAIDLDALYGMAHLNLTSNKAAITDQDIDNMKASLAKTTVEQDKIHLNFALGQSHEYRKDYQQAFNYFSAGNALKRNTVNYDISAEKQAFDEIIEVFNEDFIVSHANVGFADETPIFILGMPRAGTSLVEQILSCHADVFGAGEVRYLRTLAHSCSSPDRPFPDNVKYWQENEFRELANKYIKLLRQKEKTVRFITDKMPHNFLVIGLIHVILPNAKIIHCKRNARDTCISIFSNYFFKHHPYTNDLQELGTYYKLYENLMDHWHRLLPGSIYDVSYEDLIANQREQTMNLLRYCDLEWDDACLAFHDSKRTVKTLSVQQVRKPLYRSSVNKWQHYQDCFEPLFTILDG